MFKLSDDDWQKVAEWKEGLPKVEEGSIGGRYTYSFIPTSLGVVVQIEDCISKEVLDLTNYMEW